MPESAFVVLGGPPWEETANQTSIQMARQLARHGRTLYVCRATQDSAIRRLTGSRITRTADPAALRRGLHEVATDLFVLVPPSPVGILPLITPEWARQVNREVIAHSIHRTLRRLDMKRPFLIAYWWMFPELVAGTAWKGSLFEVVDRHWDYPGGRDGPRRRARSLRLARETLRVAAVTSAVSPALAQELAGGAGAVRVLPNAVDVERVRRIVGSVTPRPRTVGYVGGMNSRIDLPFLCRVMAENPDREFHFVGSGPLMARVGDLPNAVVYGDMPYGEAMRILATCRTGIIPFRNDAYVRASNLLKPLDYLAVGISCLATALPNLADLRSEFPDWVVLSDSPAEWGRRLRSMEAPRDGADRPDLSRWDTAHRAELMLDLLG